jgi:hypothetical protein
VPERRCKAPKKTGEQCKNAAIQGGTVCRYHGGASKFVKQVARARLDNASDLIAKQLLRMAVDDNVADAVKLTAIRDALDRAGLKARNEVVVSAGSQTGFDEVFEGIYSGAVIRDESLNGAEAQADSSRFCNEPNTAPVDPDIYTAQAREASDFDRPSDTTTPEQPAGWQSQRAGAFFAT